MDEDIKATLLIFAATWIVIFAIASSWPKPPLPELLQPEVYADLNMKASVGNPIWWTVDVLGFTYSKIVYVYNPNAEPITLEIYWEAFPQQMTANCSWSSVSPLTINATSIAELRLYLTIYENPWLGTSSFEGDCLTQIKAERGA
jgi:hypothetical protein